VALDTRVTQATITALCTTLATRVTQCSAYAITTQLQTRITQLSAIPITTMLQTRVTQLSTSVIYKLGAFLKRRFHRLPPRPRSRASSSNLPRHIHV